MATASPVCRLIARTTVEKAPAPRWPLGGGACDVGWRCEVRGRAHTSPAACHAGSTSGLDGIGCRQSPDRSTWHERSTGRERSEPRSAAPRRPPPPGLPYVPTHASQAAAHPSSPVAANGSCAAYDEVAADQPASRWQVATVATHWSHRAWTRAQPLPPSPKGWGTPSRNGTPPPSKQAPTCVYLASSSSRSSCRLPPPLMASTACAPGQGMSEGRRGAGGRDMQSSKACTAACPMQGQPQLPLADPWQILAALAHPVRADSGVCARLCAYRQAGHTKASLAQGQACRCCLPLASIGLASPPAAAEVRALTAGAPLPVAQCGACPSRC